MSIATVNETQGPPAFQDTDIVTEIENFTADVFALKRNWEQAYIAMDLLPSPIKSDLKYTYNVRSIQVLGCLAQKIFITFQQYQEFINITQVVANEARSEYLQRMSLSVSSAWPWY